jgi:hypothetical protein
MGRKKVLVLGGNFAGLTAALAVRHELHGDVDVVRQPVEAPGQPVRLCDVGLPTDHQVPRRRVVTRVRRLARISRP